MVLRHARSHAIAATVAHRPVSRAAIPYGDGFVNVATALFPVPKYTVYKLDGNFQHPRRICDLEPSQAFPDVSWHHSFAVGGKYAVVVETPCVYLSLIHI